MRMYCGKRVLSHSNAELATKSCGCEIVSEWCGVERCNLFEEKETPEFDSEQTVGVRMQNRGLG